MKNLKKYSEYELMKDQNGIIEKTNHGLLNFVTLYWIVS